MKRISWFIIFQVLFVVAAVSDFLVTNYAVNYVERVTVYGEDDFNGKGERSWGFISRGYELHERYNLVYAVVWWSLINLIFCWVQPTAMWQAPRVAFLVGAFWPVMRNIWFIWSVTV